MDYLQFLERIKSCADEIGARDDGNIASHKVQASIHVEGDDDADYELVDIDVSQLWGCGCWSGIVLKISRASGEEG